MILDIWTDAAEGVSKGLVTPGDNPALALALRHLPWPKPKAPVPLHGFEIKNIEPLLQDLRLRLNVQLGLEEDYIRDSGKTGNSTTQEKPTQ